MLYFRTSCTLRGKGILCHIWRTLAGWDGVFVSKRLYVLTHDLLCAQESSAFYEINLALQRYALLACSVHGSNTVDVGTYIIYSLDPKVCETTLVRFNVCSFQQRVDVPGSAPGNDDPVHAHCA